MKYSLKTKCQNSDYNIAKIISNMGVPAVSIPVKASEPAVKPVFLDQSSRVTIVTEFKSIVRLANASIKVLSQHRIDPVSLGSKKALIEQLKSVQLKLEKLETKIASAIMVKPDK